MAEAAALCRDTEVLKGENEMLLRGMHGWSHLRSRWSRREQPDAGAAAPGGGGAGPKPPPD